MNRGIRVEKSITSTSNSLPSGCVTQLHDLWNSCSTGERLSRENSADPEAVYQLYSFPWIYIDTGMKDVSNKKDCKRVIMLLH